MTSLRPAQMPPMESALIADCGSNVTRVVLIEVVDNAYRFVARGEAPSTAEAPYMDVTVGIINAIALIEATTGRKLLSNGRIISPQGEDGIGVDAFLASSSAAEPLRLVAVGLVHSVSADAASRGSHATYTTLLDTISLDDYGDNFDPEADSSQYIQAELDPENPETEFSPFKDSSSLSSIFKKENGENEKRANKSNTDLSTIKGEKARRLWRERQIAKLRRLSPNFIVMSGGNDGAPYEPLFELLDVIVEANRQEAVLAMATGELRKSPTLIYAGNITAQDALLKKIAGQLECFLVDNIRPESNRENLEPLQAQLSALYQERLLPGLPGFKQLEMMSRAPINTTCRAVGLMTQYLAHQVSGNRVLTADLGGNNTSLFYATENEFASMVQGDFGLSYGLSNVLAQATVANVLRWIPFAITEDEIVHYALNKTLRPHTIPADERERYIEAAFAREALRQNFLMLSAQKPGGVDFNRIIGAGGPLVNSQPWHTFLLLLDAFEPVGSGGSGLIDIELDSTMLMSAAGTLASFNPNAAAYIFQYDCLHRLGSVIVPVGHASPGSLAVSVTLNSSRGRTRRVNVNYGEIVVIPFHSDQEATLEIAPTRNFRVGSAEPGQAIRSQENLSGSILGLVIDARGRPLRFPSSPNQRQTTVAGWFGAYRTALQQLEQDDDKVFVAPTPSRPVEKAPVQAPEKPAPTPPPSPAKIEMSVIDTIPAAQKKETFKPASRLSSRKTEQEQPPAINQISPEDLLRQELTARGKKKKK